MSLRKIRENNCMFKLGQRLIFPTNKAKKREANKKHIK